MLKNFQPRLYQQTILGTAVNKNTLVVLPTGLGKTAIAFMLTAQRLRNYPNSKILMLAPTKPLCEQHLNSFKDHLNISSERINLFTGEIKPEKRTELWKESTIIISTPQGLENDIINNRINLKEVSLLIFDEAHHAVGDYSYVWVAERYHQESLKSLILGLTASPGSDLEKVTEVCKNLFIEKVEVRTETDSDVKQYVKKINKNWVEVELSEELKKIQNLLIMAKKAKLLELINLKKTNKSDYNKTELLMLQKELQKEIFQGQKSFETLKSLSLIAEAIKIDHALELLESQGVKTLSDYFNKVKSEAQSGKSKAVKNLLLDVQFKSAIHLTENLIEDGKVHPKIPKLIEMVEEVLTKNNQGKIIVFTQFRDTAEEIISNLNKNNILNNIFIGQAKKNGVSFSQKKQKEVLDEFREGNFNVLVATSVAEEGLDIPKVDKVIFYEPIPSAIRSIQRRGRTGRLDEGEMTVLVTKNTRDQAYRWSAHHKEKRMHRNLEKIRSSFSHLKTEKEQVTLEKFVQDEAVTILADHREKSNKIVKELINLGVNVKTTQLEVGDYLISGTVGVELKKIDDFVNSIIDGRLLSQAQAMKQNFQKSVLILEGDQDLFSVRNINANAIRGMLSSLALDFNIAIIPTKNPLESAKLLAIMAKREQNKNRTFSLHEKKPLTLKEQQEFVISSLPDVGLSKAKVLLEHFKTIKKIVNSNQDEITAIKGLGKKTAQKIIEVFDYEYVK
jgi:ERCC4-related helicase